MYNRPVPTPPSRDSSSSTSSGSDPQQRWAAHADVPTSVHNLLSSTKKLQEILQLWSIDRASDTQVSDVFIQIVTDFNNTVNAFQYYRIDLSDLQSFPTDLRAVLEQCLAENASPQLLEMYMPLVRRVIFQLLQGLQMRQDAWRSANGRS